TGERIAFVHVGALLDLMRASFGRREGSSAEAILARAARTPLLLLDELGDPDGGQTDFARRTISRLVEERKTRKQRTIITTNLTQAQIKQQFGEAVYDRVLQAFARVALTGESLRRSF